MAEKDISRKRIRSDASEGEVSVDSQESMLSGLDQLDVDNTSVFDDSASGPVFKVPRRSATRRLEISEGSFLPDSLELDIEIGGQLEKQKVYPLTDNYVIDLLSMVSALSKVATCNKCKNGPIEIFEIKRRGTSASKLLFRCNMCNHSTISMSVGDLNSKPTNILDTSCVLGARLAGMNSEQLRTYHASISIPPPPTTYCYPKGGVG